MTFLTTESRTNMRTTVTLAGTMLAQAEALSGIPVRSAMLREALKALIQRKSVARLARIRGDAGMNSRS